MIAEIEQQIRQNVPWVKLPTSLKQSLGNSQKEYEKMAINYSIKNQLRHKGNLVRTIRKDERKYYEELLKYSRDHLMLYPYHLSDVMVKGLRVTPFAYYTSVMADIMTQEKSYDSLPNFTAADCLRLMAIGRNQYIDIMNQCRSSKKFFRKKPLRELLPRQPVDSVLIEPWWVVQHGYIVEEDIKLCTVDEKKAIDRIIDNGPQLAGCMDFHVLHRLYRKGLVYLDVPITDDDHIIVPPLEGFVMNRVLGDYFETLLYKIFVSIDEHTSIAELSKVLEIDLQLVKNAISMFCRLGFGRKKVTEPHPTLLHESWSSIEQTNIVTKKPTEDQLLLDWANIMNEHNSSSTNQINSPDSLNYEDNLSIASSIGHMKRIAFMFDSTLTAFLMMGNLSPGLKSHAVTMFEVGKLSDESLDSFLAELDKVDSVAEGEAQRYFDHAVTLRDTVQFLRYNRNLANDPFMTSQQGGQGLDLLRCESLLGLDAATCSRVLNKNYSLLVSVAPLSNEVRPVSNNIPYHLGPAIPEVNSIWFKLFIYSLTGNGPPSLLLVKGTKLRKYPKVLKDFDRVLVTTWGHDPAVISSSNVLLILNDALAHSALLVQGHGTGQQEGQTVNIPFPLTNGKSDGQHRLERHTAVQRLDECIDLRRTCGYLTMLKTGRKVATSSEDSRDSCISPSGGGDKDEKVYRGMTPFDLPTPCIEVAGIDPSLALYNGSQNDSIQAALGSSDLYSTEERTVNQVPAPDGVATGQKQDREKLKLELGNSGRDKLNGVEEYEEDDWVLLDCCFGIPLFDRQVNKTVCHRIESHKLCHETSLKELSLSNRRLGGELLKFVHQNQMMTSEEDSQSSGSNHSHGNVPLPTRSLVFDNEKLSVWDGV